MALKSIQRIQTDTSGKQVKWLTKTLKSATNTTSNEKDLFIRNVFARGKHKDKILVVCVFHTNYL